jgi:UDP-glucose 4-epimerase
MGENMKILVTGAAGYIGSIVTERLIELGHEVIALDNLQAGHQSAVSPQAKFIQVDLANQEFLKKIFQDNKIEAVIHMAAEALIAESIIDPHRFFVSNVTYGLNLLSAMLESGVKRIIFSSTAAIYGEPERLPITEAAPKKPVNSYGESKLMFERILHWYHKAYGIKYIALRYFNAAGASRLLGEHHIPETHLIPLVLQVALGNRSHVEIYGTDYDTPDGTCLRDYIHVQDLAQAHVLALENLDHVKAAAYNMGNGDGYSVLQIIESARQITGHAIPAIPSGRRPGDPARLVASSGRMHRELGWEARYPALHDIIESAWLWHKAHPQGYLS